MRWRVARMTYGVVTALGLAAACGDDASQPLRPSPLSDASVEAASPLCTGQCGTPVSTDPLPTHGAAGCEMTKRSNLALHDGHVVAAFEGGVPPSEICNADAAVVRSHESVRVALDGGDDVTGSLTFADGLQVVGEPTVEGPTAITQTDGGFQFRLPYKQSVIELTTTFEVRCDGGTAAVEARSRHELCRVFVQDTPYSWVAGGEACCNYDEVEFP